MIYELRLYSVAPGRMGDLHARIRDHVPALFERHGVSCIGRWSSAVGPRSPLFAYLIAHENYEAREATWGSLYSDPRWLTMRSATNAGSEMIERYDLFFLKLAAGWTPISPMSSQTLGGLQELIFQRTALGETAAVQQFLTADWLPKWRAAGAQVMGVFDMATGIGLPQSVVFLAWPDVAARHAAWKAMEVDVALVECFKQQRQRFGRYLFGNAETYLLQPTPYALPSYPWAHSPLDER